MPYLSSLRWFVALPAAAIVCFSLTAAAADEEFSTLKKRLETEKPKFAERQQALLEKRYDLSDRSAKGTTMSGGKPVQEGVRVKLADGTTWEKLSALSPEQIKEKQLWPAGFLPLPHPHHEAGGMVFPKFLIKETMEQTERDLTRFDLDFDLPNHFLPEFPAPIYLTTRPDLGDVSQGKLVTLSNFNALFKEILNPKQLEGLRLLLTPFPQQDFTEFEQRAAYFDGIPADAARKGTNVLERGSQVHFMAEFQSILDFPPAPKLNIFGKLDLAKANESEIRGQEIFFGKGQCATCHIPPYYTDNSMHNLKTERFFKEVMINGRKASADGPIKTFPLRGIKDSPPYLHDDRLLTLEDSVEFFNLVLELKLNKEEKSDLVAFMRVL